MICKWCGATVDVSKGKCLSCGKSIPPISDCGGFYNVAPKATRMPEQNRPIEQPQVQSETTQKGGEPIMANESQKSTVKKRSSIPLVVGIALLAVAWIVSFAQTGVLNKRMAAFERANVQNSDAIGELTRSIESVSARLSFVEGQLEEQDSQPPEKTEPEPQLEEQDLSFFSFTDSDGKHTVKSSIAAADIIFDSKSGKATCFFNGERLWEARLFEEDDGLPSPVLPKTYVFNYDVADDILGGYAESKFTWRYRIPGSSKWEDISEDEEGVETLSNLSESTSKIMLSNEWLEEHVPDGKLEIECVVERGSKSGGTVKIEFGTSVEDPENPFAEQN